MWNTAKNKNPQNLFFADYFLQKFFYPEKLFFCGLFAFFANFGAGAPVRSQRSIHIFAGNL